MTSAPVHVRQATHGDRPALEALWSALLAEQAILDARVRPSPDAEARGRATLADLVRGEGGTLFVADWEGAVAGFLTAEAFMDAPVFAPVPEIHLSELYVVPGARRLGVAQALLDAAAAWARESGAVRLRMGVLWHNEASRRMVERWGAIPLSMVYTRELSP